MPIYEYRCSQCGHELEALQRLADAQLTVCPSCKAVALVKQVSAAGFQLKGSGWYATDFRGGNKAKPTESSESGKADAKSDAKPDGGATSETTAKKTESKASETSTAAAPASRPADASG